MRSRKETVAAADIDFVVSTLNPNDEAWATARRSAAKAAGKKDSKQRYRDWGLLRYWFRSIEINAPWVRRVHVVTETAMPNWLRHEHPRLQIVDGWKLNDGRKTFNSHSIEACIDRIPGLAERFVYFNDDFFLTSPVEPRYFFERGMPRSVAYPTFLSGDIVHVHAMLNATGLINKHLDRGETLRNLARSALRPGLGFERSRMLLLLATRRIPPLTDTHLATPMLKSDVIEAFAACERELERTRKSVFRSRDDVAPIYLASLWAACNGRYSPVHSRALGYFVKVSDDSERIERLIARRTTKQICINDDRVNDFPAVRARLQSVFERRYPTRSAFER